MRVRWSRWALLGLLSVCLTSVTAAAAPPRILLIYDMEGIISLASADRASLLLARWLDPASLPEWARDKPQAKRTRFYGDN